MKTILIITITLSFDIAFSQGIKLPKVDKDSVDGLIMYTCGCFCSIESNEDPNELDYYMTFDIDDYPNMEFKYMEKVYNKFMEVLQLNGHDVKDPDVIQVSDYATYPNLKDIKTKLQIGYCPEERFDYIIKGYVVALIYSSTEYRLFIYKN
jgi:hypothetical protein